MFANKQISHQESRSPSSDSHGDEDSDTNLETPKLNEMLSAINMQEEHQCKSFQ